MNTVYHRGHKDLQEYKENTEKYSVNILCAPAVSPLILCGLCDTGCLF